MKSFLNLKQRAIKASIFIFALMFAGVIQSAPISLEVGKYRIGIISSPFSGAALWRNAQNEWECRFANSS